MFWLLMRVDRSTWADCKYTQTICEISLDLFQCNVLKASNMRKIIKYVLLVFVFKYQLNESTLRSQITWYRIKLSKHSISFKLLTTYDFVALNYTFLSSWNHLITSQYRFIFFCKNVIPILTNYLKLASRLWNSSAGIVFLFHELHSMWVLHVCSNEIYYSLIQRKRDMMAPRERSRLTLYVWTYLESQTAIVWH